ncbi:MAG: HEAT repeat domain-containing protein [Halobacteria archaeon]
MLNGVRRLSVYVIEVTWSYENPDRPDPPLLMKLIQIENEFREKPSQALQYLPLLETELDTDHDGDRRMVARNIRRISDKYPSHVLPITPKLFDTLEVDDTETVLEILDTLQNLTEINPTLAENHVDELKPILFHKNQKHHEKAANILSKLAIHQPNEVKDIIQTLTEERDISELDVATLCLLGRYIKENRSFGLQFIDEIADMARDADGRREANALGVLADISNTYPEKLHGEIELFAETLHADDDKTKTNAAYILEQISVEYPEKVRETESIEERLARLLDADNEDLRSSAATTLGNIVAESAKNKLRRKTRMDPSKQVRKAAERAVEKIEKENHKL